MKARRFLTCTFVLVVLLSLCIPSFAHAATRVTLTSEKTSSITLYTDSATQQKALLKVSGKKSADGVWKSSKTTVATVKSGKVIAKRVGTTTVTAKYGSTTYKCKVAVKTVTINKKNVVLRPNKTFTLKLNGETIRSVATSDKTIATVSRNGVVNAKKSGKATITLTGKNGNEYKCKVIVFRIGKSLVAGWICEQGHDRPGHEIGAPGITIRLREGLYKPRGAILLTTTTNDGGYYKFTKIPVGSYTVEAIDLRKTGTHRTTTYTTFTIETPDQSSAVSAGVPYAKFMEEAKQAKEAE